MWQIFGNIENPLKKINPEGSYYGGLGVDEGGGLTQFLSNLVYLLVVVGGLWAFFNLVTAGYGFLSAGDDPKKIAAAWKKIWQSMLGLLLILGSFVLAAIFGYLLFGNATAILKPQIFGP